MKYLDVIDVSTIAYEAIHGICGYKGKNLPIDKMGNFLDEEGDKVKFLSVFHSKMMIYASLIKASSCGVVVVFDTFQNKSARFDILSTYKDGRDASKIAFSQSAFKKCLQVYKTMLSEVGIFTAEFDGLEADDIIAFMCCERGETLNIRINTRDSDLLQLVASDKSHVVFFNPVEEKAFAHHLFQSGSLEEFEFGGIFGEAEQSMEEWARNIKRIKPHNILLAKVLCGDKTDSIPACVWYTKGVSRMNITDGRVEKALEYFAGDIPEKFDWDFVDKSFMTHLNEAVKTKKEPNILTVGNEEFKRAFETNMRLIKLDGGILTEVQTALLEGLMLKIHDSTDGIANSTVDRLQEIETGGDSYVNW